MERPAGRVFTNITFRREKRLDLRQSRRAVPVDDATCRWARVQSFIFLNIFMGKYRKAEGETDENRDRWQREKQCKDGMIREIQGSTL